MPKLTYDVKWEELMSHPFNELALSDREKFHTGFLKFALIELQHTSFSRSVFEKLPMGRLEAILEKDSIDLLIKVKDINTDSLKYIAIVETKFKTTLRKNQIQDYVKKTKKKREFKGIEVRSYLLSLFPQDRKEEVPKDCEFIDILDDIPQALQDVLGVGTNLGEETKFLLNLWLRYLLLLRPVREAVINSELGPLDGFRENLDAIRLRSIFERRRLEQIRDKVDCGDLKPELANTHGNALLDFVKVVGRVKYGLQWQARLLKLFIAVNNPRDKQLKQDRDSALENLAAKVHERANSKLLADCEEPRKLNRNGNFRSHTLGYNWDIWGDCSDRASQLSELITIVSSEPCRRIVKGIGGPD